MSDNSVSVNFSIVQCSFITLLVLDFKKQISGQRNFTELGIIEKKTYEYKEFSNYIISSFKKNSIFCYFLVSF